MDFGVESIHRGVLLQEVDKRIAIDGSRFKTDDNGIKAIFLRNPRDPLRKGFSTGNGVMYNKLGKTGSIRMEDMNFVVVETDINTDQ
jgi:hypothetical protein